MKITINDKSLELKHSVRAMMYYEQMTGKSFELKGLNDIVTYMYVSAIVYNETELTLDEFSDAVTSKDIEKFSSEFTNAESTDKKKVSIFQRMKYLLSLH